MLRPGPCGVIADISDRCPDNLSQKAQELQQLHWSKSILLERIKVDLWAWFLLSVTCWVDHWSGIKIVKPRSFKSLPDNSHTPGGAALINSVTRLRYRVVLPEAVYSLGPCALGED